METDRNGSTLLKESWEKCYEVLKKSCLYRGGLLWMKKGLLKVEAVSTIIAIEDQTNAIKILRDLI